MHSDYIKKVLEPKKRKSLSQATLETLTIIAYKQPITKVEIESIRGVKCDKVLQTLLEHELIKEKLIVVIQNEFFDDILIVKRGVENG